MKTILENMSNIKDFLLTFGELLGVLVLGMGIGIAGAIRRKTIPFRWTAKKEEQFVQRHGRIHELLTELRLTVRASRCMVYRFHNGGSFTDGTSIQRFSVTHESCDGGVTSIMLESQDVMLTRYIDLIHVMNDSPNKIISVGSLSPSPLRSALEINSVEYFSVTPMRCSESIVTIGFVCCHWASADLLDDIEKEGVSQKSLETIIDDSVHNIASCFVVETKRQ